MRMEQWRRATSPHWCSPHRLCGDYAGCAVAAALKFQRVWIASTSSPAPSTDGGWTRRTPKLKRPRRERYTTGNMANRLGCGSEDTKDAAPPRHHADEHRGIFQSQHIKPFPVRAAIDIGTGGVASLCVARVDATAGAIQRLMYQTQLPLHLEALSTSMSSPASPLTSSSSSSSFTLSERTMEDITNKMRVFHGAMRRNSFEGLSERAAVLSWPLCLASNAEQLAAQLTKEFKVDVRVLGTSFNVEWPPSVASRMAFQVTDTPETAAVKGSTVNDEDIRNSDVRERAKRTLKSLLYAASAPTTAAAGKRRRESTAPPPPSLVANGVAMDPRAQLDTLAFLAHAAVSQCVAPQRLLVLHEDPQRGLRLLGMGTSPADDIADLLDNATTLEERQKLYAIAHGSQQPLLAADGSSSDNQMFSLAHVQGHAQVSSSAVRTRADPVDGTSSNAAVAAVTTSSRMRLVEHPLPVDVASAHRYCVTQIQRRPLESYSLHGSSPNPLLADEFATLRSLLVSMMQPTLPPWVQRKAQLGGVLCGTSHNGGLLNIAARVSQQTSVSLEHLEVHAQHHFCGLTDVLLADSFPNPLLVLPSAALAAAVLRSLESPRITYLPEVSVAAALLVQPSLWLHARSSTVRARLARNPFYVSSTAAQRGRTFDRPHRKDNPTAAPGATWAKDGSWNPLSPNESMRGT
ncbi:hypothetical protein JKF63_07719 [Porcisia hertigi]|uniref:Uncharacterized protein n=1 Tax=Porcisia hertigi TaxID=2761500 RepID=A0A836LLU5_9TRYP|nr:hypothetical protein JKF63_07719 [Porcisia hertigi]